MAWVVRRNHGPQRRTRSKAHGGEAMEERKLNEKKNVETVAT